MLELAAVPADDVPVGLAEARETRSYFSSVKRSPNALGRFSRGARTSTSSSGTGLSTSPPKPKRSRIPAAASQLRRRRRLILIAPPPVLEPALDHHPQPGDAL